MKNLNNKRVLSLAILALASVATLSFGNQALASHQDDEPKLSAIAARHIFPDAVRLRVSYDKLEGDRVKMIVRVTDRKTGAFMDRVYRVRLNDNESVRVNGLDPATQYSFKVKMRKSSGGDYTAFSDSKMAFTKP